MQQPIAARSPHSLAIFTLVARNDGVEKVILHPANVHLLCGLHIDGTFVHGLDVGFHIRTQWNSASATTLAVIGRGLSADICVDHPRISRIQCCFDLNPTTGIVMVQDRSGGEGSTGFHGMDAMTFDSRRIPRQVAITPEINTLIGMGGPNRDALKFELIWNVALNDQLLFRGQTGLAVNPRNAETIYQQLSVNASLMMSAARVQRSAVTGQATRMPSRLHTMPLLRKPAQ